MKVKLTPSLIYEAALDDELFAQLPSMIAEATGARSCVLHWRDQQGAAEISTHSGYFTDEHMANYAQNFVSHDLWTDAGMGHGIVNRAVSTTDLVPAADYERSVFYNEWIRAMGDDTFYCCGSVMRTVHGFGIIGLHRGKTQADFSPAVIRELNGHVDHLRRMFAIRARYSNLSRRHDLLDSIFASGQHPALIVGPGGRILRANEAGDLLLRGARFLRSSNGRLTTAVDADRRGFEAAVGAASVAAERNASTCLLRAEDGAAVVASLMPLLAPAPQGAVLVTIDVPRAAARPEVLAAHLQEAFGLSPSEADIAIRLADGATTSEISEQRRSTIATVRTQVKNIMFKMDARKQGDVVRTVGLLRHGQPAGGVGEGPDGR
jgi:DNA-binding CsgD family transcriptional regulator